MAREILLHHVYGNKPGRRTIDVDFAIAVESWDHFLAIKDRLCAVGFEQAANQVQRLRYVDAHNYATVVDVLPFGALERTDKTIAWPPEYDVIMNVCGYEDVNRSAVIVRLEDQLEMRVASIPGLTVLKIFAWLDRGRTDDKDAKDLRTILDGYDAVIGVDALYAEDATFMDELGYAVDLGIARLLGINAFQVTRDDTRAALFRELETGARQSELATAMAKHADDLDRCDALLGQLLLGLKQGK